MKKKLPHTSHRIAALLATVAVVAVVFVGTTALVILAHNGTPQEAAAFDALGATPSIPIQAKAAVVFDPSDGRILYQKDAGESLPLASVTKLMTAEILLTAQSPDTPVTISSHALSMKADAADAGFRTGDVVPLRDLLEIGLIASSNVAMQAAAESLGPNYLARMNDVASNLNLSQTHFSDPTGLDMSSSTPGATASAYDVARLAALFYKQYPSYFELTSEPGVSIVVGGRTLSADATSLPLQSIPGFVGAKTGYTDLSGGNLVAVFDVEIGHPLVVVVLGSSESGRFEDVRNLITTVRSQH